MACHILIIEARLNNGIITVDFVYTSYWLYNWLYCLTYYNCDYHILYISLTQIHSHVSNIVRIGWSKCYITDYVDVIYVHT